MSKGPSTWAIYWTSDYNEIEHFIRHGEELGYDDIDEYSSAAVRFAQSKEKGILSFKLKDGTIVKYNPRTNEFIIISGNGKIVTYFKPDDGKDYYDDELEEAIISGELEIILS